MRGSSGSSTDPAAGGPPTPGLYVHVPFCRQLCPYCDFTIVRSEARGFEPLAGALRAEHAARAAGFVPATLYFGGGTPTELPAALLAGLVREFRAGGSPAEVTVEANPESATPEVLEVLAAVGVTRVSLGVQSADAGLLETLGRGHTLAQARAAFEAARAAGIAALNVDLMFGLPGQTEGQWRDSLEEVLSWAPDHVSAYALELSARVPMARRIADGRLAALPDEATERMYAHLCVRAAAAGFEHYEISNFARPGFRSLHNLGYWNGVPYVGLGPGAHSFDGASRRWNVRPLWEYIRRVEASGYAQEGEERLEPGQRELERLYLALRTADGLPVGPGAAGLEPATAEAAAKWAAQQDPGLARLEADRVRLTERGFWYSDALISDLASRLPGEGRRGRTGRTKEESTLGF